MIKIWSSTTGQIIRTLEGHSQGLSDVAWAGDSKHLASASDDKTIRIWNVELVRPVIFLFSHRHLLTMPHIGYYTKDFTRAPKLRILRQL
jgi:COMPASS component SWD3